MKFKLLILICNLKELLLKINAEKARNESMLKN